MPRWRMCSLHFAIRPGQGFVILHLLQNRRETLHNYHTPFEIFFKPQLARYDPHAEFAPMDQDGLSQLVVRG